MNPEYAASNEVASACPATQAVVPNGDHLSVSMEEAKVSTSVLAKARTVLVTLSVGTAVKVSPAVEPFRRTRNLMVSPLPNSACITRSEYSASV